MPIRPGVHACNKQPAAAAGAGAVSKITLLVFRARVPAAVRPGQVTGDEGIAGIGRLVLAAVGAFNVLDVIAQGPHGAAQQAGVHLVVELGEQGLDNLQGDPPPSCCATSVA